LAFGHRTTLSHLPYGQTAQVGFSASSEKQNQSRVDQYGDTLPAAAIARLGTTRWRHGGNITSLAFSPDGRILATAGEDGAICLHEVATGKHLRRIDAATNPSTLFAFSPDGRVLAWADLNALIHLYDPSQAKEINCFQSDQGLICGFGFSPDSRSLVSTGFDATVRVWDWAAGRELCRFQGQQAFFGNPASFSADSKRLTAGGPDDSIRVWDIATRKEVQCFKQVYGNDNGLRRRPAGLNTLLLLTFAGDSDTIVFATGGRLGLGRGDMAVLDVRTGKTVRTMTRYRNYSAVALSPDRQTVIVGTASGNVNLWRISTGEELTKLAGDKRYIVAVALSPNGKTIATADDYHTIRRWELGAEKAASPLAAPEGELQAAAFVEQGKRIVTANRDGTIRFWDPRVGKQTQQPARNLNAEVIALSPDGRCAAWATVLHDVNLAPIGDSRESQRLNAPDPFIIRPDYLAFSLDGKLLAAAGRSKRQAQIWDTTSLKHLHQLEPDNAGQSRKWTQGLAFSPDGKSLATADVDLANRGDGSRLHLWDVASGKETKCIDSGQPIVHSIAFAENGKLVLSAGTSGSINLWDAKTGTSLGRLADHNSAVQTLLSSRDGRTFAGGCRDGSVLLWEMMTRELRGQWAGHRGGVTSLAFSPDGKSLVSGSADTTALVWDLTGLAENGEFRTGRLSPSELQVLWEELAASPSSRATKALWKLVASPDDCVPFLRRKLRIVAPVDSRTIDERIGDLADDRFPVRKRAMDELEKIGEAPSRHFGAHWRTGLVPRCAKESNNCSGT
jgi:WD40 repeat protein